MSEIIRVVVADDSPFVCRLLTTYLQSSPNIQVVGTALNGVRAIELVQKLRPDALTLDLEMPKMNGLEALEHIMYQCPTPVIMVSGISNKAANTTLKALQLGAVDFVLKYTPGIDTNTEALRQEIINKVKAASKIKVIRSIKTSSQAVSDTVKQVVTTIERDKTAPYLPGGVVVIGASTGGPVALRELLSHLPADFPAAILIVQHIPASFTPVLAAQLNRQTKLRVEEATNRSRLEPRRALVAPGNYHLLLRPDARTELNQGPQINGHRPSIDVTMQSVAQVYGSQTTGVVLTGMGSDGSLGMVAIHAKGGKTFAQNGETCVIDGMPKRAIEKGVVDKIGSPVEIAQFLIYEAGRKRVQPGGFH